MAEFAGRHNIRDFDTIDQMCHLAVSMIGRRLRYQDLTARNGHSPLCNLTVQSGVDVCQIELTFSHSGQ